MTIGGKVTSHITILKSIYKCVCWQNKKNKMFDKDFISQTNRPSIGPGELKLICTMYLHFF